MYLVRVLSADNTTNAVFNQDHITVITTFIGAPKNTEVRLSDGSRFMIVASIAEVVECLGNKMPLYGKEISRL